MNPLNPLNPLPSNPLPLINPFPPLPPPPAPAKSASDIRREIDVLDIIHDVMEPTSFPMFDVSIYTDIGGRKYQEDRFAVCPKLINNRTDCAFFGVFDGTVGDFASETVKGLVVPHLVGSLGWRRAAEILQTCPSSSTTAPNGNESTISQETKNQISAQLKDAINSMYKNSDDELVYQCAMNKKDYASSTSVTAVMAGGMLGVGHLGDSRIALGTFRQGMLYADFLTKDHKPDQPLEKERIMGKGGTVEYLHNHNNKPFIRGGDFTFRKAKGEAPMQLQYSRAFGGKDLKRFGLSNDPDVMVIPIESSFKCMILASDGLWDVLSAENAVDIAISANKDRKNPAEFLVQTTLNEQKIRSQSADNITAMVVFFK